MDDGGLPAHPPRGEGNKTKPFRIRALDGSTPWMEGDSVRGRFLIKFPALLITVRMHIIVSGGRKKNLAVESALLSASTYEIVKDRGIHVRSEKTRQVREIFELFGIEGPEQLHLSNQMS